MSYEAMVITGIVTLFVIFALTLFWAHNQAH
jgi:hypothetical protein